MDYRFLQERGFPRIVEFLSLDPGCHIKLMWYVPGSRHPRAISRVCGLAGGTFAWRHWTVWEIPRRSHTSWGREDSSEKLSVWARRPKKSSNKSKDESKGPKEKKINPIDRRWSQLVDRTVDVLLWGLTPVLIYTYARRVSLSHSSPGDANRATSGHKKQTNHPLRLT